MVAVIVRVLSRLDIYLSVLCLLLIVGLISLQIVCRWLSVPLTWPDEVARFFQIWMVFLILSRGVLHHTHIRIDYFYNRLPGRGKWITGLVIQLVNFFVTASVAYSAVQYLEKIWSLKSSAAGIPMPLYFLPILAGMLLMGFAYLYQLYIMMKGKEG
ncbi:TRAP transporter small permease [Ammoniphilus sp. YIM 78166]|uniref:TRAP transporter small permease n=1 Tax=Ammoniphilus sp. YIM 78166 TaxID=1644106 RepID=UPI001F0EAA53|nr:TRAP transporter small permease [Ammoniphilus sp. YIM 78166]